jgi:6-phosphogluconolactonase
MTTRSRLALAGVAVLAAIGVTGAAAAGGASEAPVGAVYTQTNDPGGNSVVVFDRYADGTLEKREAVGTGGAGSTQSVGCGPGCPILDSQNAVVASKNGKLVFAVNAGSDSVSSFRATKGGLVLVEEEDSGGDMPESLALHGDLLYVLNTDTANDNGTTGNIYGLRISADGELSPVGSSQPLAHAAPPFATARGIEFDPTGKVIVVTELVGGLLTGGPPGSINTFVVGSDGKAGPVASYPSSDVFPFGFAFDNKGHLIVSNIVDPTPNTTTIGSVSSYDVSASGVVTAIDTVSSGGVLPCWVVVSNDGRLAFVVNTGAGQPAPVTSFGISPSGELTPIGSAESQAGDFARTDAALSRDSKYLYVLAPSVGPGAPSHIDAYALDSAGGMTLIGSTPEGANLGVGATGLAAR